MSAYYSGDPGFDFSAWEKDQQAWEDNLPHCECCGEPIDEYIWHIDDQILCEDCAKEKYRRSVD